MTLPGAPAVLDLEHVIKGKALVADAGYRTHKLHSKRLLLFTSRDRPVDADSVDLRRHVHQRVKDARDNDIAVDLFPLGKAFDVAAFYSEVLFDNASDERPPTADVSDKLEELLARVRQKSYKKRVLGKIPFVLGEGLKLAVGVYNLIRHAWESAAWVRDEPRGVWRSDVAVGTQACLGERSKNTNQRVSSITTYVAGERTLHRSEINHCQKVGDRQIAFSSDEVRELRAICEPGLHVQPASFIYPEENWIKGRCRQSSAAS
ncbi:X-ray repair cross-complementing protein 6-like [Pollicipes pollicipes]|uniref:X-ray repair cross-complementing protein 6-like n=1 Tax=Pollicipes pollicipes TaxID=41117 RepID=UPI001884F842|nr:X-ray repair cross-complementing protein 6-like [Pollicipes pollicipes]